MIVSVWLQKKKEMLIAAASGLSTINYAAVKPITGDMVNIALLYSSDYSIAKVLLSNLLALHKLETATELLSFIFVD